MKTLYLDIFSGISGDMFVGAMIDLGVDAHALERELEKLKLDGWRLGVARGQKANISGVKFDVHLAHAHTQGRGAGLECEQRIESFGEATTLRRLTTRLTALEDDEATTTSHRR